MSEELKPLKKSVNSNIGTSDVVKANSSNQARWWNHWIVQTIFLVIAVRLIGLLPTLLGVGAFYFLKRKQGATIALVVAVVVSIVAAVVSIFVVKEIL